MSGELWSAMAALTAALPTVMTMRRRLRRHWRARVAHALWLWPPVGVLGDLLPALVQTID